MLKKSIALIGVFSLIFGFASFSFAESKVTELGRDLKGETIVLCVDGLKVLQSFGYGPGPGVSIIQLYEEKNGTVVPVRCNNK